MKAISVNSIIVKQRNESTVADVFQMNGWSLPPFIGVSDLYFLLFVSQKETVLYVSKLAIDIENQMVHIIKPS